MLKLHSAFEAFDSYNKQDPNVDQHDGKSIPKELLYAQRMTQVLTDFFPKASIPLQLATRAQHIGRWEIPRKQFSLDRVGYLKWRNALKSHHAGIAGKILNQLKFDDQTIERVKFLIEKKSLKKDAETQMLEDVICLVFLEFYASEFIKTKEEEKVVDILRKTWRKMSKEGQQAALKLSLDKQLLAMVKLAI